MELLGNSNPYSDTVFSTLLQYSYLLVESAPSVLSIKIIVQSSKKPLCPKKRSGQINLRAYVQPVFQLFWCYPYSCPSDNEMNRQQSLHFANHKFYTIKDKSDIYHCNSSCDLFCIAFKSEKIQTNPFQKRSSRLGTVFHYIFQNQLFIQRVNC